ncbi:hypothetical protein EHV08_08310 [Prevotella koreensis]|uniref:Uncharacterized protein n=1 Tax=Prevotella koreensis TaxID=2490854 RepID=A0A3S0QUA4_9BACT|nr:hypothetical protein EHV08_08310 [Prevotella koreensis]
MVLFLTDCFLTVLVRLPTSTLPSHLDVLCYAFDEMAAHLFDNRTKSVKDSNEAIWIKKKFYCFILQ